MKKERNKKKVKRTRKLKIKVIPKSKFDEIIEGKPMIVRVKTPPEKGKANKDVIKLLKKKFHAKVVRIISGEKSRKKEVEIKEYD
jgi:uncharacterized protein (TIGR00251 family)